MGLVPLVCPSQGAHKPQGYYSIVMKALLNHRDRFMDTCVGCMGGVHDARMFQRQELYLPGEAGTLFPPNGIVINGVTVPTVILGDPLTPYCHGS